MRDALLRQRESMIRFNAWEAEHLEILSTGQRIARFVELYELQRYISRDKLERRHAIHLEGLIAMQKRFALAAEKMVKPGNHGSRTCNHE